MLHSIEDVAQQIKQGIPLVLAGDEQALRSLPAGNWIAGTTPYFMVGGAGVCSRNQVFVTGLPACAIGASIHNYSTGSLSTLLDDAPDSGFTILILPAGSDAHFAYAHDAASYPGIFLKPVVGWIAGVHVSEVGVRAPMVVNGLTGIWSHEQAVAMHVTLPPETSVELNIVNVFHPGSGARLRFPATGFEASVCLVDGKPMPFAAYLKEIRADLRLPLTADYNGSIVNVSIQSIDQSNGVVRFFGPVFEGVDYKLAAPLNNYNDAFKSAAQDSLEAAFACNCVLNYLYCDMEGRSTSSISGPVTYGEIAHLLLNQTLVRLVVRG